MLSFLIVMFLQGILPGFVTNTIVDIGFMWVVFFVWSAISVLILLPFTYIFKSSDLLSYIMAVMLLVNLTFIIVGFVNFKNVKIKEYNLKIDGADLTNKQEMKILAVSDLHIGYSINKIYVERYVKLINNLHPDLILISGDIADRSIKPIKEQGIDLVLKNLESKYGVYSVVGNHESYGGDKNAIIEYLESSGIRILKDEYVTIDNKVTIIGRDDRSNSERENLDVILSKVDPKLPKILLDHQPYHLSEVEGKVDLQLSGHTHLGQFWPVTSIVKRMYELPYGYLKKGKTHFIVSSGLGLWGPKVRLGSNSEIVIVNLTY